jgi:hypothetical protein
MARLNAEVDEATRRELYHALLDDGLTFADWMRRAIDAYLAERRSRPRKRDPLRPQTHSHPPRTKRRKETP